MGTCISRLIAAAAFLVLGCTSSAPYTIPAAAVNSGLALGAAAAERAAGGCYAVCTGGTVCNPKSGFCERDIVPPPCRPGDGGCAPLLREQLDVDAVVRQPGSATIRTIGISPATGRAPSPPPGSAPPPEVR